MKESEKENAVKLIKEWQEKRPNLVDTNYLKQQG